MRTQTLITSIVALAVLALGATTSRAADKADANGTWSWTQQGGRGGQGGGNAPATPRKFTLKLKADGEKLTGTLTQPGFARRGGDGGGTPPAPVDTAISNGKIKGDEIAFEVTREFGGQSRTTKYTGKIAGDAIKGKVEMPGRQGGDPVSRDWEAKREK